MRRISHLFALSVFTTLALTGALTSSALAEESKAGHWLINGATVTSSLPAKVEGEFLLEDTKAAGAKLAVVCSEILTGTIVSGEGSITEVLNLAGEKIGASSSELGLKCSSAPGSACAASTESSPILVWDPNLPYAWLWVFFVPSRVWGWIYHLNTWIVDCLVLGVQISDTCKVEETTFKASNVTGGIELEGSGTPNGSCTIGGAGTDVVEASGSTVLMSSPEGTLTGSE